jgi:hypothetical protein
LVNRAFTGEWSANGAIVKLAINNPFLTPQEKLADYTFNFSYAIFRNIEYHFTDSPLYGYLLPGLALVPLTLRRTRRVAALLWLQVVAWLAMVALNGQVRWQNERYTMPAVAWLLLLATLGVSGLLRRREKPEAISMFLLGMAVALGMALALRPTGSPPTLPLLPLPWLLALALGGAAALACRSHLVRVTVATAALGLALFHQAPRLRDQKWFFGRASRNIRDQHIQAGRFLAQLAPRRVLVGDAGALLYASGTKGLDLIGLGGYHSLPFARAGIHGLAASIELIERMAPAERPDVFAIYPSWWGHLPTWFARRELARFPVEGNVICGGAEKVIYEADWHVLGTGHAPRMLPAGDHVVDAVDIADLVSEKHHGYRFPTPAGGWTDMKILADPAAPKKDLFDGGRRIAAGRSESFTVGNLAPNADATLILRTAPDTPSTVRVVAGTTVIASLALEPSEGWVEKSIPLPKEVVRTSLRIAFENDGPGDFVDYHVWVTQR